MFVFSSSENQENQKTIEELRKSIPGEFPVFSSHQDLTGFLEKNDHLPQIGVCFIREPEEAPARLEAIHQIFDSRHQMVYLVGIAETEAKKYEKNLSELFECLLFKPVETETLLKEIKKGESLIQNLNSQINVENLSIPEIPSLQQASKPELIEFFDSKLTGLRSDLDKIRHSVTPEERKQIFHRIKDNLVWPEKLVMKHVQPGAVFYDEGRFFLDEASGDLKAKTVGLVEMSYSELHFYPSVELSPDGMKAFGFIFPLSGMDDRDGLNLYIEGMKNAGVSKGLLFDAINRAYMRNYESQSMEYTLIAEGKLPQDGYAEYVELKKNRKEGVGKIIDKIGTIDYREHSNIINLKPGEVIAEKVPEKPAVDGYDVTGKVISAKFETKTTWILGENTEFREETQTYHALVEGMLVFENNTAHLKETIIIEGDVNIKTGNVHSNKNIVIKGNVDPDMYVEAKGNVIIGGIVEDAKIVAGGSLEAHGFSGSGKTWVFCKGDLTMDFCQNAHLEALGNIHFRKFVVNAEILTAEKLTGEDKSRVFGGRIQAAKGCDLFELGNNQEVPTKVVMGVNFYNEKIISKILDRMNVLKKEQDTLVKFLKDYLNLSKPLEPQLRQLPRTEALNLLSKINELKQKHALISKLEGSFKALTQGAKDEFTARLKVRSSVFGGVDLSIVGTTKKITKKADHLEYFFSPAQADIVSSILL